MVLVSLMILQNNLPSRSASARRFCYDLMNRKRCCYDHVSYRPNEPWNKVHSLILNEKSHQKMKIHINIINSL